MTTKGDIRIERAERLVYNILRQSDSKDRILLFKTNIGNHVFWLKKAIPIHISYITCAMRDGLLETYQDIYTLDKGLVQAFYNLQSKK